MIKVGEKPKATPNEDTLRVNEENIGLNKGLTHDMVDARTTIISMQTKKQSNLGELHEVLKSHKRS